VVPVQPYPCPWQKTSVVALALFPEPSMTGCSEAAPAWLTNLARAPGSAAMRVGAVSARTNIMHAVMMVCRFIA